jgi:hypothetical protein
VSVAVLATFGTAKDVGKQLLTHWFALLVTPWLLIAGLDLANPSRAGGSLGT